MIRLDIQMIIVYGRRHPLDWHLSLKMKKFFWREKSRIP
jgi:hypothetical protein